MEIRLDGNRLCFGKHFQVTFQRTLRIPDDGRAYPLPPGLGEFPLRRVDDHADRVPSTWLEHGGVFLPMYQREATWLRFSGAWERPRAVKVGVGKVCALTGQPWSDDLHDDPQDYLVTPPQPWLDGILVRHGRIRQFVAMPLGSDYTVEGQITGEERHGGLQLRVFEPRPGWRPEPMSRSMRAAPESAFGPLLSRSLSIPSASQRVEMGLAAGGQMKQKIRPDPHGIATWDPARAGRVFVHIVDSERWRAITGEEPPPSPVTARRYTDAGLPWFETYEEHAPALAAQAALANLRGTAELDEEHRTGASVDDRSIAIAHRRRLWPRWRRGEVRDGSW